MSYCLNPSCPGNRNNPDESQFCQSCSTVLTIEGNRGHRYRIIKPLSQGHPYTEIFQAIDLKDQQTKVLKTLKEDSPKLVELFQREADLLIRLKHPAIPHYEDYFEFLVGASPRRILRCLVMEYFEGADLEQWIRNRGKLDEATAIDWLKQLLNVVGYVHENGCFHRDIKPSNLLRKATTNGKDELALIDFGIAKETANTLIYGRQVTIAYTSGYAPPEQAQGESYPQSDFYALGRTFVHLLTGLSPNDPRLDLKNWRWSTNCSDSPLIDLLDQMMQPEPEQRPQSVREILQRIKEISQPNYQNYQTGLHSPPIAPSGLAAPNPNPATAQPLAQVGSPPGSASTTSIPQTTRSRGALLQNRLAGLNLPMLLLAAGAIALMGAMGRGLYCRNNPVACTSASQSGTVGTSPASTLVPVDRLISSGGQPIAEVDTALELESRYRDLMDAGMRAFAKADYQEAESQFQQIRTTAIANRNGEERNLALQTLRNPLPLIYASNATARQRHQTTGKPLYSIGVAVPLNTDPGVDTLRGVALIQQKAIQEGINVEFVLANDRNLPAQSKAVAQSFVNRSDILAVIGHYTSSNTCAGLSVYDPAELVLISPVSTVLNLRWNCSTTQNQVFFRTTSSTAIEAKTLVRSLPSRQALNKERIRVAIFYNPKESDDPKTAFSPDLAKQFEAQLATRSGEVLGEPIDLSDPNFDAEVALHQVRDADALAVLPDGQFDQSAFKNAVALIKANQGEKIILGANTVYSQDVFEQVGEQAQEKLIMAVEWQQQCGNPAFVQEVNTVYAGGGINRRTALAYEAAQVLIAQISRDPQIDRAGMRSALADKAPIQSDVADTTISFDPATGDREEYNTRILVTLERQGDQFRVVPLNDRCDSF